MRHTRTPTDATPPVAPRVLRPAHAARYVGLSRGHLYRLEAAALFPRRVRLTPGASAYLVSELDEWISARAAERDGGPPRAA
jgi:predicted DNA-binding transcriptional regulator AlpA